MTKKDFELIAHNIAMVMMDSHGMTGSEALIMLAEDMANSLQHTNPRFDRARFLAACGVTA